MVQVRKRNKRHNAFCLYIFGVFSSSKANSVLVIYAILFEHLMSVYFRIKIGLFHSRAKTCRKTRNSISATECMEKISNPLCLTVKPRLNCLNNAHVRNWCRKRYFQECQRFGSHVTPSYYTDNERISTTHELLICVFIGVCVCIINSSSNNEHFFCHVHALLHYCTCYTNYLSVADECS